jgi:hypothetical protein
MNDAQFQPQLTGVTLSVKSSPQITCSASSGLSLTFKGLLLGRAFMQCGGSTVFSRKSETPEEEAFGGTKMENAS